MSPLAAIIVLAQVSGTTTSLAETLRALEDGADVQVSRAVGAEAARALEQVAALPPQRVDLLLRAAVQGRAHRELGAVAARLLTQEGPVLESMLRTVAELEARERGIVLGGVPAVTATRPTILDAWAHEDEATARGAILVAVPACQPQAAVDVLRRVAAELPERAEWVTDALARARPSQELLAALVDAERELSPSAATALGAALAALVDRDPSLAGPLVEALDRESTHALLAAVVALPPEHVEAAARSIMGAVQGMAAEAGALTPAEVQLLAAAITAGGELRRPELLFELPGLLRPAMPTPVRVAALRALGAVGARETGTIDLLIGHLSEPEPLASAAYEALLRRARVKMPQRPAVWQEWRARTPLTEMTPDEHVARLAAERAALFDARRVAVRRAMRDEP